MPALLTGRQAELAREALPRPLAQKPDGVAELAKALLAFADELRRSQAQVDAGVAAAIAEQSRASTAAIGRLAATLATNDGAVREIVQAMQQRKAESIEMRITERDEEGRIKAVSFTVV